MKTTYGTILVLAIATVMLFTTLPCGAVEKEEENIWREDEPERGHRRLELMEERIERVMNRLAETDPEKAEELARLREKDPERFKAELRKVMQEQFGKKFGQRREQRGGRESRHPQDMPRLEQRPGMRGGPGGPGMRGGPGGPGMPGGRRMREMHAEYLQWLKKNYPEEAEKLAELRERKPELYMRKIALSLKKYGRIAKAAKENPELAQALKEDLELRVKRDELLGKIRAASDDEKQELVEQLEGVVGSRFELIVRRKQMKYEQLRKQLEELKERVKKSEAEVGKWKEVKSEKVKERLEELISRTEKFNWD